MRERVCVCARNCLCVVKPGIKTQSVIALANTNSVEFRSLFAFFRSDATAAAAVACFLFWLKNTTKYITYEWLVLWDKQTNKTLALDTQIHIRGEKKLAPKTEERTQNVIPVSWCKMWHPRNRMKNGGTPMTCHTIDPMQNGWLWLFSAFMVGFVFVIRYRDKLTSSIGGTTRREGKKVLDSMPECCTQQWQHENAWLSLSQMGYRCTHTHTRLVQQQFAVFHDFSLLYLWLRAIHWSHKL